MHGRRWLGFDFGFFPPGVNWVAPVSYLGILIPRGLRFQVGERDTVNRSSWSVCLYAFVFGFIVSRCCGKTSSRVVWLDLREWERPRFRVSLVTSDEE